MSTWIGHTALSMALVLVLAGCAAPPEPASAPSEPSPTTSDDPASSTRLAPGLYEREDGTVQVVGTLEYRDLEGGLWAIVDGTGVGTEPAGVVAVIANADEFARELKDLEGKSVAASGVRFEGVSIRMAGPEIEVSDIVEVPGTLDPVE